MDEIPIWFEMVPEQSVMKKGTKFAVICGSWSEKHLVIALAAMADRNILPPIYIFKVKTNRTIHNLVVPEGFVIATQEKGWKNEERMLTWLRETWFKYTKQKQEKLQFKFPWSLLTLVRNVCHKLQ